MVGGEIRFDLSSQTVFPRQTGVTQPTEFTSSILSVSSSNILQIKDELQVVRITNIILQIVIQFQLM